MWRPGHAEKGRTVWNGKRVETDKRRLEKFVNLVLAQSRRTPRELAMPDLAKP